MLKETDKLASKPLEQWPTYAATLAKCADEEGHRVYHCQQLKRYSQALSYYSSKYEGYCSRVSDQFKSRLSCFDLQLMRDIIYMLSLYGWEKVLEEDKVLAAIDKLVERFGTPLQSAETNIDDAIRDEFAGMIEYSVQYISNVTLDYHSVWLRLFHGSNSAEWSNFLVLAEPLFSPPALNGKLD